MPGTGVPANYLRDSWFFPPWLNLSGTVQMSHIHEKKSRGWSGSVPDFLKYLRGSLGRHLLFSSPWNGGRTGAFLLYLLRDGPF